MKRFLLALAVFLTAFNGQDPEREIIRPFESEAAFAPVNGIDDAVLADLKKRGIRPAPLCSDQVFLRRAHLDVIGTLPEPREIGAFLKDSAADKRAKLIDALLERREFADYWSMKWCDILRVKSEFPINLWPNGVQAYHKWVHQALRKNMPYDAFARALLTSSGSNFRVPAVNFYRGVQDNKPRTIAAAVALTFLGARLEAMPEDRAASMKAFFSRIAFKGTAEWKEQIVFLDPKPVESAEAVFPDGSGTTLRPDQDPRIVFADWLITPENPWFARAVVNRAWAWLMGRGIVHEPDDIRPDNPPVNPELLAFLEKELVGSGWDLRHLYRLILNSRTYQQSSIPAAAHGDAEACFAHYIARRLDAEVLIDALCRITGTREQYFSQAPEPFTFIPGEHPTIRLPDGSISSSFLDMFGRPARDTGLFCERNNTPSDAQRLHLLNSSHIQTKIETGRRMQTIIRTARGNAQTVIRTLYMTILSRPPSPDERTTAQKYFRTKGTSVKQAAHDLAWALINTKEFLYRH
ncbi:MAG: DUF1553 domain-containing protein [Planctomycetota bacterium]|jgi:hypothetical protein